MHVAEAKKLLGTRFQWICDSMDNDLKHALGDRPNSEFIISPEGEVVVARQWSRPDELRTDLEELVGPVRRRTEISDLRMKPLEPPRTAGTGIVPRVQLPGSMSPVQVEPVENDKEEPFYVKLRVEVESEFFRSGCGRMYLGFFLDPLHKVHWNNRAMPVSFEVTNMKGVVVADSRGSGPDVTADADADPREFLLDLCGDVVDRDRGPQQFEVTVRYFACDDAETFCKPVTQSYHVALERDRDGGSRRSGGSRRPGAGGTRSRSRGVPGAQERRPQQFQRPQRRRP